MEGIVACRVAGMGDASFFGVCIDGALAGGVRCLRLPRHRAMLCVLSKNNALVVVKESFFLLLIKNLFFENAACLLTSDAFFLGR
ncbi:hypothetical protein [Janthinobacterium sp. 1_2014MBL_MicDiv]|uniref:hypothetical protein n=1 Tax=Janthinobacterium sp. 1_2014MBL_MicDiv TaxID=1644131 RepID=UPI0012EB1E32|nr:hypothetical protein [Janthinobacterium sp. 1_2014MBL_MicDiv]